MILKLVTAPAIEPVDLASAKLHLRIDATDEDDLIESLIEAARGYVEAITRRALLTSTWDYSLQGWPYANSIKLPGGNLQSVTSVKWLDTVGVSTTLTVTTDYLVETNGDQCGRVVLPYGDVWPIGTLYPASPITIRYVAGWDSAAHMPHAIVAAVKMVVAKLYEGRGEDVVGQTVVEDKTVARLLESYRLWDEF